MFEVRTVSVSIAREWREVYEAIWRPEVFPRWASGLAHSALVPHDGYWEAQGPDGTVKIRFTDHNAFGVMDHHVEVGNGNGNGLEIYVPMRVIQNDAGAEVTLTLFRQPDMSDEKFKADTAWVRRDLDALKKLVLHGSGK
ncbi:polyketide cyclase [Trinickia sp. LjRoot230]|uniref:polyketide cyclase n=1 Tax=Trinickia sp. LjRoot230 TaxID=3342288 RepID=UPI003ECC3BA3